MAGWFRKPRQLELDDPTGSRRDEVESLLPASVKHPEANRFTPLGSDFDGDDESDEDIEFLESIVRAVEGDAPPPVAKLAPAPMPLHTPAPTRRIPISKDDDLSLFREIQVDRKERTVIEARVEIEDVELADLLEDLSTTAAALRRRKAA